MEGEGTPQEIIDTFSQIYRTTPNPAVPQQKSPSEAFLGRSMRTVLDALKPKQVIGERNVKMEETFNRRHGARPRHFNMGDLVYVRNFSNGRMIWLPGRIVERVSHVLYRVNVNSLVWTRHINHLRPRSESEPNETLTSNPLPLDILLDTYQIQPSPVTTCDVDDIAEGRRFSTRVRAPVQRLEINPRLPTYGSSVVSR